jgi:predicted ATPase
MPIGSTFEVSHSGHWLEAEFSAFLKALALAHPIRVRKALTRLRALHLTDVETIVDPHAALRFVYLIDKVYDDNIRFSATSSVSIRLLFSKAIYHGGDTKKYLRAMSRIEELVGSEGGQN